MKIIKHKNKIFFIFKRYQARNQKDDFKIRRFRINYDKKYEDLISIIIARIKTYLENLLSLKISNKTKSSNDLIKHFSI